MWYILQTPALSRQKDSTMTITYRLDTISHPTALFCQYPGQSQPQAAHVTIDEYGSVTADYSGDIGNGCLMRVWHGLDMQYRVAGTVDATSLVTWLQTDAVRALLERVHAGHSVEWDGSNYTGCLTDDGLDASDDFARALEAFGQDVAVAIWSAAAWVGDCPLSDVWPDGVPAQQAADDLEKSALAEGIYLHDSMLNALLGVAARHFDDDGDDCLTDVQIAALVEYGLVTQADADARAAAKKADAAA